MPDVAELVHQWGYLALFLIVVLGNVGLPVPEESALIVAGYLVWQGELGLPLVLAVGVAGAVAGDNVGYWIGRRYGAGVLERFRRLIGASAHSFEAMRRFVVRYGPLGVFSARFIAGLRFMAGPLAGAMNLGIVSFMVANVLGALAFVPLAVGAGYAIGYGFGDSVERIQRAVGRFESGVLTVAALAIGMMFIWRLLRAFRTRGGS